MRLDLNVYEGDANRITTAAPPQIKQTGQDDDSPKRDGLLLHSAYEVLALMGWLHSKPERAANRFEEDDTTGI